MDQPSHPPIGSDTLDRLTFLGWRRSLAAIMAGLAVSFLLFGYFVVYWRNADMDFMVIYSALAMNAGKPQQYLDHTAYLTILSVKSWFALLHGLGLLDAWTLPGNAASDRVLEKSGFRHEGTLRQKAWFKGAFHDFRIFGRIASDATSPT